MAGLGFTGATVRSPSPLAQRHQWIDAACPACRQITVLVDLERRQPIDLLPDRESETLAKWLQAHPTVRVISRDRAGSYAEGDRQGAPDAVQVADRFHLFCNLTQALQRVLERLATVLQRIHLAEPSGSRSAPEDAIEPTGQGISPVKEVALEPPIKLVAFWLTKPPMRRSPDEQRWLEAVTASNAQVATAEHLAQQFRTVFKERNSDNLKSWLARILASEIPELKCFVAGVQRDYEAVVAAVEQHWSNGQVEGQVHRLKLLKRQMYGRSGFLLLRRRVLPFRPQRSQHSP